MNNNFEKKLPPEILENIFQILKLIASNNVKECMTVCKVWYPVAKQEFYRYVEIGSGVKPSTFLSYLGNYDFGEKIQFLTITGKSKRASPPFLYPNESKLLFTKCKNLVKIKLMNMNPYYILRGIEKMHLKRLSKIDVCWDSCQRPPSVKKWFCRANLAHRESIKEIDSLTLYYLSLSITDDKVFDDLTEMMKTLSINS